MKLVCIACNNRVARAYYLYTHIRITFTWYIILLRGVHLYIARGSSTRKRSWRWASIEIFLWNRWMWGGKPRRKVCRVAHNDNGDYKRRPSVSHSGSDVCLRNMIKRSRLSSTRGGRVTRGVEMSCYRASSIDTRTITYRALLISLMGPTTCDGLYVAGIKRNIAASPI